MSEGFSSEELQEARRLREERVRAEKASYAKIKAEAEASRQTLLAGIAESFPDLADVLQNAPLDLVTRYSKITFEPVASAFPCPGGRFGVHTFPQAGACTLCQYQPGGAAPKGIKEYLQQQEHTPFLIVVGLRLADDADRQAFAHRQQEDMKVKDFDELALRAGADGRDYAGLPVLAFSGRTWTGSGWQNHPA